MTEKEALKKLLKTLAVVDCGKQRWTKQDDDTWYDIRTRSYITFDEMIDRAIKTIEWLGEMAYGE